MRALVFLALAAAIAVGCSSPDNSAGASTTGTTGSAPQTSTTTGSASNVAATGKYAAVQAIFSANCVKCHSGPAPKAGIDLSSYESAMKGGRQGAVINAGDAAGSKLVMALHGQGAKQMPPPPATVPAADIATIEAWITAGAKNG
ncbi:MAG: c-type cytochrome domain-containing protein [Fimbriimonadaceae bacterium]